METQQIIKTGHGAIVTIGDYQIPVTILGFDGNEYKVTADLPKWISKANIKPRN